MSKRNRPTLGPLEHSVMQVLWSRQQGTAEEVRQALAGTQELKESTVRTILRRLEEKGYLCHDVEGRTYIYRPRIEPQSVAAGQVRGIIERFCRGSVEKLLVGMVDEDLITPEKLRELADRIAETEGQQKKPRRRK
jgi:BlaI family transcriptional regulator, penicillinase repressor